MKLFFLLIILNSSTVLADSDLDQLRQSFTSTIQSAKIELDRAAAMQPIILQSGTELSSQDCLAAQIKIRQNYKVDPFEVIYEEGSAHNLLCVDANSAYKNLYFNTSGKSNQGLPYTMAIQLLTQTYSRTYIKNFFLDQNFHIVEIQNQYFYPTTSELLEYSIASLDTKGNVYSSEYTKNFIHSAKGVEGTRTIEKYISIDGSHPNPVIRNTVKHKTDSSKDYQILSFDRADKVDWDDYQLPITHAWFGGFYNYGGKYFRFNKFKSSLTIKSRGGKEFCSIGSIKTEQGWQQFPLDSKAYYDCVNN